MADDTKGTSLTFLGAARTVTGSKHLLQVGDRRLLVDCGMFQGLKALRERNWQALPLKASSVDAVVLTHAHLDHAGRFRRISHLGCQVALLPRGVRPGHNKLLPGVLSLELEAPLDRPATFNRNFAKFAGISQSWRFDCRSRTCVRGIRVRGFRQGGRGRTT